MTCDEAVEQISAMLDGELTVSEIARLQHHLAACDSCRAAQASESWLHSLLAAGALADEPPDALRRRIRDAVRAEVPRAAWRSFRWRRAVLPALVGSVLCVATAVLFLSHEDRAADSAIIADVLMGHRAYARAAGARLDVDAADAGRLEQWMRDRLGVTVRLPARAGGGEAPIGARVVTVGDRPAAQILYEGAGRRVSLFVAARPRRPLPEEGEHVVDGVDVYTTTVGADSVSWWQDGRQLYLAVSGQGTKDLVALAARCIQGQRSLDGIPGAPGSRVPRGRLEIPALG